MLADYGSYSTRIGNYFVSFYSFRNHRNNLNEQPLFYFFKWEKEKWREKGKWKQPQVKGRWRREV